MTDGAGALPPLDGPLAFLGERLRHDVPLGPYCTYRVGGAAARLVEIVDADELGRVAGALARAREAAAAAGERGDERADDPWSVLLVGRGSNLLVSDAGFPGLVVTLGESFDRVEPVDPADLAVDAADPTGAVVLRAGAAASLPVVARRSVALGLSGFEWAVGVPGSIGGAVRMNAGGHGADMSEVLVGVRVVDLSTGEDGVVHAAELDLGYRRSSIGASQVVVHADLQLAPGDRAVGEERLSEIVRWRREHQPGGQNAGSVFTNPAGDSAGRLIDEAGCKGLRVGSAEVSNKHANFIQADPDGSADDVVALMETVIERVHARSGVRLHAETVLVGFAGALLDGPGSDEPGRAR